MLATLLAAAPAQADSSDPLPDPLVGTKVLAVDVGDDFTCAIRLDHTVGCWWNDIDFAQPRPPTGKFNAVSAGGDHACAIRTAGTLACWGNDKFAFKGTPTGTFKAVSAGLFHTCAIRNDNTLACWGSDELGQASPPTGTFTALAAAQEHNCAIRTDGTLACWGDNSFGGTSAPAGTFTAVAPHLSLRSCGIRTDGTLACWGDIVQSLPAGPYSVLSDSCALRPDGTLVCLDVDAELPSPPAGTFVAVSSQVLGGCAMRTDETLACWGKYIVGLRPPATDAAPSPGSPPWLLVVLLALLGAGSLLARLHRASDSVDIESVRKV